MKLQRSLHEEPSEIGIVFDSIPLEFSGHYKTIDKFIFFKWGHYFVGSREFDDFSSWEYPERLHNISKGIRNIPEQYNSLYYIWDISVIWNLVKEIRHFHDMHIVNDEDLALIKKELFDFLDYMEDMAKGAFLNKDQKVDFYISNVNIGMYGYYHFSPNHQFSFMKNYFIQSAASQDYIISNKLREWVDEMKKVSTLISGSGAKARKLFFEEQRSIVDTL
mgnify:FL=1